MNGSEGRKFFVSGRYKSHGGQKGQAVQLGRRFRWERGRVNRLTEDRILECEDAARGLSPAYDGFWRRSDRGRRRIWL